MEADFVIANGVLTKYNGAGGDVMIPDGVCVIGQRAFYDCLDVTRLHFPESLVRIETQAFYNCQGLTQIEFPTGLQEIEEQAFYNCWRLTKLVIPAEIKVLRKGAFENCQKLTSVTFSEGLEELEGRAFGGCHCLEQIHLPDSVTRLHKTAFAGCDALTDLCADGIPLNDLTVKCRQAAMVDFARRLLAGEDFPPDRQAESLRLIRASRKKLYPYAVQYEDLLRLMLAERMVPQRDIQLLMDEAEQQDNAAAKTVIQAYQP